MLCCSTRLAGRRIAYRKPSASRNSYTSGEGEGGIGTKVAPQLPVSVSADDRLQHLAPAICGVHVARTQGAPFQIAELVEHEQRMIAGTSEVTVVGGSFLFAMGSG